MTVRENRSATHTYDHTEVINEDIETHINYQDRTTSHDNKHHNNNLTRSNNLTHNKHQQLSSYQHKSIHEEPQCCRCGQYGHYKRGYVVNLDNSKRGLNFKKHLARCRYSA